MSPGTLYPLAFLFSSQILSGCSVPNLTKFHPAHSNLVSDHRLTGSLTQISGASSLNNSLFSSSLPKSQMPHQPYLPISFYLCKTLLFIWDLLSCAALWIVAPDRKWEWMTSLPCACLLSRGLWLCAVAVHRMKGVASYISFSFAVVYGMRVPLIPVTLWWVELEVFIS